MIERRGFLRRIIAAGVAPLVVRDSTVLMPIKPALAVTPTPVVVVPPVPRPGWTVPFDFSTTAAMACSAAVSTAYGSVPDGPIMQPADFWQSIKEREERLDPDTEALLAKVEREVDPETAAALRRRLLDY